MYLLDTNICIYIMKGQFPCLNEHLFSLDPADVAISSITVFELEYGAFKSNWGEKTRTNLKLFLAPFQILPFDGNDAVTAGYIRSFLILIWLCIHSVSGFQQSVHLPAPVPWICEGAVQATWESCRPDDRFELASSLL